MKNAGPSEQRYGTQWYLVHALERELGRAFDGDAGAEAWSAKARAFYTKRDNGLVKQWWPLTFWNPPYEDQARWMAKALVEAARGNVSVGLVKLATDARYWRPIAYECGTVDLYEGRLAFIAPPEGVWKGKGEARRFIAGGEIVDGADFASALVWLGPGIARRTTRYRDAKTGVLISPASQVAA